MALYHLSAKMIGRGEGRSVMAAAAYRAGVALDDARQNMRHDYTQRRDVLHAEILAPDHAPAWALDRQALWSSVDAAEKRKDAQTAREVEVSLPRELSEQERLALVRDWIEREFVVRGMVADFAIHSPTAGDGEEQPHCHILLTTRVIEGDWFGKKERAWNDKALLEHWRESWAVACNAALEDAGSEARVDHRSLAEQGISRAPTIHEGPAASALRLRGDESDRAAINDTIVAGNSASAALEAEIIDLMAERDRRAAAKAEEAARQAEREAALADEQRRSAEAEAARAAERESLRPIIERAQRVDAAAAIERAAADEMQRAYNRVASLAAFRRDQAYMAARRGQQAPAPDAEELRAVEVYGEEAVAVASKRGGLDRFKMASAKRRREREAEGKEAPAPRISDEDVMHARATDPTAYLHSCGYRVVREGRASPHFSVKQGQDEVFRLTRRHDGAWLWTDKSGSEGGDNIALAMHQEGVGFREAVARLIGYVTLTASREVTRAVVAAAREIKERVRPVLPVSGDADGDAKRGRDYLLYDRQIEASVLDRAERAGALAYSWDGPVFIGRDEAGDVRAATKRLVAPREGEPSKRDLPGTDKRFPAIFPGDAAGALWIVEGGTDALAVQSLAARRGLRAPTALATGGVRVKRWFEEIQQPVADALAAAKKIYVAAEHEKKEATQATSDAARAALMERLRELAPHATVVEWTPPEGVKDVAAYNEMLCAREEQEREWAERAARRQDGPAPE